MADETYIYRAFISYRHVENDRKWAAWLDERLEAFRTPRALVEKGVPERMGRVFRDDNEIPASNDLSRQIEDALKASEFLIVICSPRTPHSKWVRREISIFQKLGRADRIFALLTDGDPEESFPPELLHVARERIGTDGAKEIEWKDAEPIAADVRPREGERKSVTTRRALLRISAALLGVRYDDLAQRAHHRRVQQQRLWGAVAAALLLALGISAYFAWYQSAEHLRYYAYLGSRWGAPYGIGELSASTASHRERTYAVRTRAGRVTHVTLQNGLGTPMGLYGNGLDSEAWDAGVAEWIVSYDAEGRVSKIALKDASGREMRLDLYRFLDDGSATVTFTNRQGGAAALTAGASDLAATYEPDYNDNRTRSQITLHGLTFTAEGWIARRLFKTPFGNPAGDMNNSFGRAYRYDSSGLVISISNLDQHSRIVADSAGIATVRRGYTAQSDYAGAVWLDAAGRPVANPRGYTTVKLYRDPFGNQTSSDFLGPDGKAVSRTDSGCAHLKETYDTHGDMLNSLCLGVNNRPFQRTDSGYATILWRVDAKGRTIEEHYLGRDNKPTAMVDRGYAWFTSLLDEKGRPIDEHFFGVDGKPVRRSDTGCASNTYRYDDAKGFESESSCFGLDGKPTLRTDMGFSIVKFHYDDRGNRIEEAYFGTDGKQMLRQYDGIAAIHWTYDDGGNESEAAYFGLRGELVASRVSGAARFVWTYDSNGVQTVHLFDIKGQEI